MRYLKDKKWSKPLESRQSSQAGARNVDPKTISKSWQIVSMSINSNQFRELMGYQASIKILISVWDTSRVEQFLNSFWTVHVLRRVLERLHKRASANECLFILKNHTIIFRQEQKKSTKNGMWLIHTIFEYSYSKKIKIKILTQLYGKMIYWHSDYTSDLCNPSLRRTPSSKLETTHIVS